MSDIGFSELGVDIVCVYSFLKECINKNDIHKWFVYLERMGADKSKTFNLNNKMDYGLFRGDFQILLYFKFTLIITYPSISISKELKFIKHKLKIVNKNMTFELNKVEETLQFETDYYSTFNYISTSGVVEAIKNEVYLRK